MSTDLQRASKEASRLFVDIYEKLETRKVDPGIDFKSLVDVFRNTLKNEAPGSSRLSRTSGKKFSPILSRFPIRSTWDS